MKKLLRWLFANEWEKFTDEMRENDFWHKTLIEKNLVAERYLKNLGYELIWHDPVHEIKDGDTPLPIEMYGWELKKILK